MSELQCPSAKGLCWPSSCYQDFYGAGVEPSLHGASSQERDQTSGLGSSWQEATSEMEQLIH